MKSSTKWIIAGVVILVIGFLVTYMTQCGGACTANDIPFLLGVMGIFYFPFPLSAIACIIIGFVKMGNNK